ncbi:MAG TPA: nuclear transport factor 2 family protein, partial [Pyrinomonadaceae bacterium]
MKRAITATVIMLVLSVSAQPQGREAGRLSKDEQQVLAANREWADAMVKGDSAALERLFHDELIVTTGNGNVRGKEGELKDTAPSADMKTYFFNTEDVRVRVYDDAAIVTGHAKWRINYKGRDID